MQIGAGDFGVSDALYGSLRLTVVGLWLAAAIDTARIGRELEAGPRRLAHIGTLLLLLPVGMSAYDAWDNAVARPLDPILYSSWLWALFDGLAPAFCLWLLRTLRERNAAQAALREMAVTDPLTNLPNRRGFFARATGILAVARRQNRPSSLMLLDLDRFKAINDGCGHSAGDAVLRQAAAVLGGLLRVGDLPVRWGGEEFAVLLPFTTQEEAAALAERLRAALPAGVPHPAGGGALVTASIGIATLAEAGGEDALARAIREADRALYRAKAAGRNRVVVDAGGPEPLPGGSHADMGEAAPVG